MTTYQVLMVILQTVSAIAMGRLDYNVDAGQLAIIREMAIRTGCEISFSRSKGCEIVGITVTAVSDPTVSVSASRTA